MKTSPLLRSTFAAGSVVLTSAVLAMLSTQSPVFADGLFRVRMHAPPLYQEGVEAHTIRVLYPEDIDETTLDNRDLWVVSHNGYNELARFEEVVFVPATHELEPPPPPAGFEPAEDEPADPNSPVPEVSGSFELGVYRATYRLPAPNGDVWTANDNGSYAVLLEPDEVGLKHGGALGFAHLGFFEIKVGETPPEPVFHAEAGVVHDGGKLFVKLIVEMPDASYEIVDWGDLTAEENRLAIDLTVEQGEPSGQDPARAMHVYGASHLAPGEYRLIMRANDKVIGEQNLVIEEMPSHVPAEVDLNVVAGADGKPLAEVTIHFIDPFFVLADPGEPVLDGNHIVIEAKAQEVVFVQPPEEPAITELTYELPVTESGGYLLVYKLNGETKARTEFIFPLDGQPGAPVIHRFHASPERIEWGEEVTLSWEVSGAEHLEIEPGIGRVDGSSITIVPSPGPIPLAGENEPAPDGTVAPIMMEVLVPAGAEWRYLDHGSAPPAEWTRVDFDDSEWDRGPAELGYGDGDEATVVSAGEEPGQKRITTYFRHLFDTPWAEPDHLRLWLKRDDGAVVYLNGEEVHRSNMPDGEIGPETLAIRTARNDGNGDAQTISIDPQWLGQGLNVLAVEIHQASPTSSDISLDAELDAINGVISPPSSITYTLIAANAEGSTSAQTTVFFGIDPNEPPLPREAMIEVVREGDEHLALVDLVLGPEMGVIEWSDLRRDGNAFIADVQLVRFDDTAEPPAPEPPSRRYRLGLLDAGEYKFILRVNGTVFERREFRVEDGGNPSRVHARLIAEPIISATEEEHLFEVVFESAEGIALDSLGDDDILVVSRAPHEGEVPPLLWEEQSAEYKQATHNEDLTRVVAVYGIAAPAGGWIPEMNGSLSVLLEPDSIETRGGSSAEPRLLGTIDIQIGPPPPVPVDATLKIVREEHQIYGDVRVVFDGFPYHTITDWGEPRRDGDTIILSAEAAPLDWLVAPEEPVVEEHRYLLWNTLWEIALPPDFQGFHVLFKINGETYARAEFGLNDNPPPPDDPLLSPIVELASEIDANGTVNLFVRLDYRDAGIGVRFEGWGDLVREDRHFVGSASVARDDQLLETPGAPPVFEYTYSVGNLAPAHYQFVMKVNGEPIAHTTFVVPGDDPFAQWLHDWVHGAAGDSEGAAPPSIHSLDDADGDGSSDFYEYALGTNPMDPEDHGGIEPNVIEHDGQKYMYIQFNRRTGVGDLEYHIEVSDDLLNWQDVLSETQAIVSTQANGELERVTVALKQTMKESVRRFVRVRVETPGSGNH